MAATDFEFYRGFYYVAKYGTTGKAAAMLYTAQPNVTKSIRNLENTLGCSLFTRSARGMTLTVEGETLYARIAPACEILIAAEKEMGKLKHVGTGMVRISTNLMMSGLLIAPALRSFRDEYRDVTVEVYSYGFETVRKKLVEGDLDLALDYEDKLEEENTSNHQEGLELRIWKGIQIQDVICASPKFGNLAGRSLSAEDLAGLPLISRPAKEAYLRPDGPAAGDIVATGLENRLQLTLQGLGISILPYAYCRQYIESGKLLALSSQTELPERKLVLFTNARRPLSIAAERFRKVLMRSEYFNGPGRQEQK